VTRGKGVRAGEDAARVAARGGKGMGGGGANGLRGGKKCVNFPDKLVR
jgi:hypothetical protein